MSDSPPDRLSATPGNPHYDEAALQRGVGVRFRGQEKTNVEEYSVPEGWVKLSLGAKVDRKGQPLTQKLTGEVQPYWRDAEEG